MEKGAGLEFEPFPVSILSSPIEKYVREASKAIGCDTSFVATPLLSILAACVGNARRIELKRSWKEPCVFWAVIVGNASTLKSPAIDAAASELRKIETERLREYQESMEEYKRDLAIYKADLANWQRVGRNEGEPPPEEPREPAARRVIVSDATVEALCPLLEENPRGLLLLLDELATWISGFDAYRSSKGKDVPQWLSMHRAGQIIVDRKTGKRLTCIPRGAVSVTGGIQPKTLQRIMGPEFFVNGFMSRLLFAMPPQPVRRWTDDDIDPSTAAQLRAIMERLLDLMEIDPETGELITKDLPLSPEAKAVWVEFYNQHAQEQSRLEDDDLSSLWGKLEGYAARFALLDHVIRSAIEGDFSGFNHDKIGPESLRVGIELSRWYGREVERVFAFFGKVTSQEEQETRELVRIVQKKGGRITTRELMQSSRKYRSDTQSAEAALNRLVEQGLGRFENEKTGGRPKTVFVLTGSGNGNRTPLNPGKTDLPLPLPPETKKETATELSEGAVETMPPDAEEWGTV